MNEILKTIGAAVLAGFMILIPILLTVSLIYNWYGFIILLLFVGTLFVWGFAMTLISNYAKESSISE